MSGVVVSLPMMKTISLGRESELLGHSQRIDAGLLHQQFSWGPVCATCAIYWSA
ncbi:MAG: hypothetical protein KAG53_01595 [Endozoicomonadaceae bacterium]|nr:hypothetical protein [Endozoicomonadaceae bacterium]